MSDQNGENGSMLYAWVRQEDNETGVARLRQAWIPLGTINLVAFDEAVMSDPRLVEALQESACHRIE
jgi:hypothetical protein